ncbi:MAG: hypothetical protein ACRETL_00885, partial [Gammaproteobacteria bacterium]
MGNFATASCLRSTTASASTERAARCHQTRKIVARFANRPATNSTGTILGTHCRSKEGDAATKGNSCEIKGACRGTNVSDAYNFVAESSLLRIIAE